MEANLLKNLRKFNGSLTTPPPPVGLGIVRGSIRRRHPRPPLWIGSRQQLASSQAESCCGCSHSKVAQHQHKATTDATDTSMSSLRYRACLWDVAAARGGPSQLPRVVNEAESLKSLRNFNNSASLTTTQMVTHTMGGGGGRWGGPVGVRDKPQPR